MSLLRFLKVRTILVTSVVLCVVVNLAFLVLFPPNFVSLPCPVVLTTDFLKDSHDSRDVSIRNSFNCTAIYRGDDVQLSGTSHKWCQRRAAISNHDYVTMTSNCEEFIETRRYFSHVVTAEETDFPLAFSILMHENVEQFERLLRAIYRPHNAYCIHVDRKASPSVHTAVKSIAKCLPNVTLASKTIPVHWAEFSLLEAELTCLEDLWNITSWKYYLNLAGSEFPIRTNLELVQILKVYNGANEVEGSLYRRPVSWTKYSYRRAFWRTGTLKSPAPHGFLVAKGSTHVAASRAFIDYALHDAKAQDLLEWMKDVRCPDEHFFSTLNHNPQRRIPGAYTGDPDKRDGFYVRYKQWYTTSTVSICHGKWRSYICVLGSRDLHKALKSKHMFLNKVDLDMDPVAFQCLEQWYNNKVQRGVNPDFDIKFYKNRDLVKQHVKL